MAPSKSSRLLYVLLGLVFLAALIAQGTYTVDVIAGMQGGYPRAAWDTVLQREYRLMAVDGRPFRGNADLARAVRVLHPGDKLPVTLDRKGARIETRVNIASGEERAWYSAVLLWLFIPLVSLGFGFWVAAIRVRDGRAWLMLGILIGISQMTRTGLFDPLGWPEPLGVVGLVFRNLAIPLWSLSMGLFGIYFPHRWKLDERVPWLKWLLIVGVCVPAFLDTLHNAVAAFSFAAAKAVPDPFGDRSAFVINSIPASLFFMGLSMKYHDPGMAADDRRRLRILYVGCSTAMLPLFLLLISNLILGRSVPDLWYTLAMIIVTLFPLTMAYVIVVERAMDVRVVLRQGVQYALARGGIRVIQVIVIGVAMTVAANAMESRQSLAVRTIGIAVAVTIAVRIRDVGERLRQWLDRRFFREAYNAEQILGELSEQVRSILDTDALLTTVTRKISESLHVERIAVLLRDGGSFRPALATGYPAPLELTVPEGTAAVAEVERTLHPELLLPLASRKELLGFISLGPKKSEEPYSPSDASLLRTVAAQTGLALENARLSEAIAHEAAQRELLNREIEIAREVQQRLFPQNMPEVPTLEYGGHCRPARGVGGDYYDFLALSTGRLGLAIGDVSGKGVPAALLMASLQASVRGQSQSASGNVAELISNVNRLVCDASPENRYATFFYAQFDPASQRLVYTNAGHNPPLVLRGEQVLRLEQGGPPVGLFRFSPYVQAEVQLEPADLLILFTDGISEAENPAQEEWGEDALIATARGCIDLPPAEMITRVMQTADAFAAGAPQHDDMTLVVARVLG
jgi:sigma-B regulation protein RsbU (phosphoserine phosphatase)